MAPQPSSAPQNAIGSASDQNTPASVPVALSSGPMNSNRGAELRREVQLRLTRRPRRSRGLGAVQHAGGDIEHARQRRIEQRRRPVRRERAPEKVAPVEQRSSAGDGVGPRPVGLAPIHLALADGDGFGQPVQNVDEHGVLITITTDARRRRELAGDRRPEESQQFDRLTGHVGPARLPTA